MLEQCLEIFKLELNKGNKPDAIILDNLILPDGDYVLVHQDGSYTVSTVKYSKKERCLIERPNNYRQLCFYDYNSRLVSMNKPQDPGKTIHSNNYLSLFVKKESFKNGKMNDDAINRYFKSLENPQEKYKGNDLKMYNFVTSKLADLNREELLKNKAWLIENIYHLENVNYNEKNYLKVFFEADDSVYLNEGNRYTLTKIFNSNDYNLYQDGEVYGLPNYNMQLNSKKPFLENKSRGKSIPHLISLKEAIIQKKFFDYLMNQADAGKTNIYISTSEFYVDRVISCLTNSEKIDTDFEGIFLKIKKGKELEIHFMDTVVSYKAYLKNKLKYRDIIGCFEKDDYKDYNEISKIEALIDNVYFSKLLKNNYMTPVEDLKNIDSTFKTSIYRKNLLLSRDAIFAWVRSGRVDNVANILYTIGVDFILYSIGSGYIKKAQKQLNLLYAIDEYFAGEEREDMNEIFDLVREKINSDGEICCENDIEYSLAVGQMIRFLQSKSKSRNKNQNVVNQFLTIKNDTILKNKVMQFYKMYNYDISSNSKKFNRLFQMVLGYEIVNSIDQAALIFGYVVSSLIYEKEEKNNG